MKPVSLDTDCTQCAALCCVALAFDRSAQFALDKKAGEPCPHLSRNARCRIHSERAARGFGGCIGYDCRGAGQYVTQVVFDGKSWLEDRARLLPMMDAFAIVRELHGVLIVLNKALAFDLPIQQRERLEEFQSALQPDEGWRIEDLKGTRVTELIADAKRFLLSLRSLCVQPSLD